MDVFLGYAQWAFLLLLGFLALSRIRLYPILGLVGLCLISLMLGFMNIAGGYLIGFALSPFVDTHGFPPALLGLAPPVIWLEIYLVLVCIQKNTDIQTRKKGDMALYALLPTAFYCLCLFRFISGS